jgi:hypothetical protein
MCGPLQAPRTLLAAVTMLYRDRVAALPLYRVTSLDLLRTVAGAVVSNDAHVAR